MRAELSKRGAALVDFVVHWGLGWRYIVSRQFRRRVHERWASRSRGDLVTDFAAFVIAFVALNGLIVLTCLWLYAGIVAVRLRSPVV
jgi:hypothetical protein